MLFLAYEQIGLLYAVLALSACHLGHLTGDQNLYESIAVEHRVKAITALGVAIRTVCSGSSHENVRDGVFATIQILLLHDVRLWQIPFLNSALTATTRYAKPASRQMGPISLERCPFALRRC